MEKFTLKKRVKSFEYAFKGLIYSVRTQHNIWIHLVATVLLIWGGFHYNLSNTEWCIIILCIGLVLSAEIINSSIESLTDMVSPEYDKFAGKVKDMAAGGVLLAAIAAAAVGCIIFIPKILL
jgi:diacylglycerol kinase (ATP)